MQVTRFVEENDTFNIKDIHSDHNRFQLLCIGEFPDNIEIFFKDLNHLKQFSEQLNKQIKEVEK